jgi:putative two-component system response regulator
MIATKAPATEPKPTLLVVDDTPENLQLMNALLRDRYRVRLATRGEACLELAAQTPQPDLILLDIMMPGIDGYETCRRLKSEPHTAGIPVIFLTAMTQESDQEEGFRCGCVDFITKPISPALTLARVATHLSLKRANDLLTDHNTLLVKEVEERTQEVQKVQDVTILAMASLAETRDNETGMHIRRTQNYVRVLAEGLLHGSDYAIELDQKTIKLLYKSAPLHDIGKVGIPDGILLKPGKLTPEEFATMKQHAALGARIIASAELELKTASSFLRFAREIANYHHENWDGSGYPDQLVGTAIPLSARLMAVADVYDALISKRCYKPAFSHDDACEMIIAETGRKFDPVVINIFKQSAADFSAIAEQFKDSDPIPLDSVEL